MSKVYFGVSVSPLRAEFLAKCLELPLCKGCGREESECSADPCDDVIKERHEPVSQEEYLNRKGAICPSCQSSTLSVKYDVPEIGIGNGFQTAKCKQCGAEWQDNYELSGYIMLD